MDAGTLGNWAGAAVLAVVLGGLGWVVAVGAPATAAPPTAFDVIAVGVPGADCGVGAVDVHYPDGTQQRLTPSSLGITACRGWRSARPSRSPT